MRLSAPMRQSTTSYSTSARSGWIFDLSTIHNLCISFSLSFLEHLRNHGRRKIVFRRKRRIEVMSGDSAFGNLPLLEDWEANWHTVSFYDHWCAKSCNILGGSKEAGEIKCTSTVDLFIFSPCVDHLAPRILYCFIQIKKNNQDFGSQQIQGNRTYSITEGVIQAASSGLEICRRLSVQLNQVIPPMVVSSSELQFSGPLQSTLAKQNRRPTALASCLEIVRGPAVVTE
jgi:hypothetical protein